MYVKGTLREGGQIEYKTVLARDGLSWAVEYIELYFPAQNNSGIDGPWERTSDKKSDLRVREGAGDVH